jgi:hypothetical protein
MLGSDELQRVVIPSLRLPPKGLALSNSSSVYLCRHHFATLSGTLLLAVTECTTQTRGQWAYKLFQEIPYFRRISLFKGI